eukprot:scaffold3761_cov372-Prasinococcus_capsulatus_cf.AAC.33
MDIAIRQLIMMLGANEMTVSASDTGYIKPKLAVALTRTHSTGISRSLTLTRKHDSTMSASGSERPKSIVSCNPHHNATNT